MARPETKLAKALEDKGWTLVRKRSHQVWRCGCGRHQAVVAASVGKGRAMANAVAFLSSVERFGDCAIEKGSVLG